MLSWLSYFKNPDKLERVQADISTKLEESRRNFPHGFSKAIQVLPDVNHNTNGEWEKRLRQAKEGEIGERFTIIPYNVKKSHWIGVILKFDADGQIHQAEFIDPVEESDLDSDKLQTEFSKVFPEVVLQSKKLQKHDDEEQSLKLTVANLLQAIQEDGNQLKFHKSYTALEEHELSSREELGNRIT